MKIKKAVLDKFNARDWGGANDSWNIGNGYPTEAERAYLLRVYADRYGMFGDGRVTLNDIRAYEASCL